MSRNACHALREAGTAVWLDQLSRELIRQGKLQSLMQDAALTGVTSNPAIFHKAMTAGSAYDDQIAEVRGSGLSPEQIYEQLAVRDIQMACDVLRPVWEETKGADGFVSLEVSPHLALDADGSIAAARRFHEWVKRPNVFIKVPGTAECIPAIERLLADGIAINITLLFSVDNYEEVARGYVRALRERASKGLSLDIASVASFFVSRIDTLTDQKLEEAAARASSPRAREDLLELRGKAAIANAKVAYQSFLRIFGERDFRELQAKGARVQRPLWASTSTKNPAYRDVMYVEPLVGHDTVNTMPMETIEAFMDHGQVLPNSVELGVVEAHHVLRRLEEVGIPFHGVTDQLLREGITKFNEPYDKLLKSLEERLKK